MKSAFEPKAKADSKNKNGSWVVAEARSSSHAYVGDLKASVLRLFKEKGKLNIVDLMDELGVDDVNSLIEILNDLRKNDIIRSVKAQKTG